MTMNADLRNTNGGIKQGRRPGFPLLVFLSSRELKWIEKRSRTSG